MSALNARLVPGARMTTTPSSAALDAMKPTQPAPDARFVLRIAGVVLRCTECGNDRFIKLSPTDDGKLRFGCTGCDASYLVEGAGSPRLLED